MKKDPSTEQAKHLLYSLEAFFSSWRFPVFMLSVLFFFAVLVLAVSMIPVSGSTLGAFAEEFKTWCLGYDPATGEIESIYLAMFIVQPAILSTFVIIFWYRPLSDLLKEGWTPALPAVCLALVLVLGVGLTLPSFYSLKSEGELPFPAESLRTEFSPPSFTLVNQHKEYISLDDYRGENVIMLTAVYASCAETCPLILEQAKQVLAELNEKEAGQVQLMALTMDPSKDTPDMLKMTADHYELTEPNQHLLTGEAGYINEILDKLNIPRIRREDGAIDHANLFILIDKNGTIAYRFTLGDRQQKWLLKATRLLVQEDAPPLEKTLNHSVNLNLKDEYPD